MSFVKRDTIYANLSFVFGKTKPSETYIQVAINNNTKQDMYLYYPVFGVLRERNGLIDTLSISSLWGNNYLGDIRPFIFKRQDSLSLRFRESVRNNREYQKSNWNNPIWALESDDIMIKNTPIVHFVKKGETLLLRYYVGNITEKGKYTIRYISRKEDQMYKFLPSNFEGFELYMGDICVTNFSFYIE